MPSSPTWQTLTKCAPRANQLDVAAVVVDLHAKQAPDKSISIQGFSGEIFPAYEIIFTNWLPSKESKV